MATCRLAPHLTDPSGGLGYHLRAWRWRHTLWTPFLARTQSWLRAWRPPAEELVVVGPSAGYTLDADFLARFRRIHALEPDPLARWLLRRRWPKIDWRFGCLDALATADGPAALAAEYPRAAILFANVLGQAVDPGLLPAWRAALGEALGERYWASYHDVLSAAWPPRPVDDLQLSHLTDAAALARALYRAAIEVIDHDTFGLAPHKRQLACWQIAPARWQVVEWGQHAPDRS